MSLQGRALHPTLNVPLRTFEKLFIKIKTSITSKKLEKKKFLFQPFDSTFVSGKEYILRRNLDAYRNGRTWSSIKANR